MRIKTYFAYLGPDYTGKFFIGTKAQALLQARALFGNTVRLRTTLEVYIFIIISTTVITNKNTPGHEHFFIHGYLNAENKKWAKVLAKRKFGEATYRVRRNFNNKYFAVYVDGVFIHRYVQDENKKWALRIAKEIYGPTATIVFAG